MHVMHVIQGARNMFIQYIEAFAHVILLDDNC